MRVRGSKMVVMERDKANIINVSNGINDCISKKEVFKNE